MKELCSLLAAIVLGACASESSTVRTSVTDETPANPAAARQFERLKSLVGDWHAVGESAPPQPFRYRLSSGGTAIVETLFVGSDHEMVSVYHLQGGELMLTHYCVLGNQPNMVARPGTAPDSILFECLDGSCALEEHMHSGEIRLVGDAKIESDWTLYSNGEVKELKRFTLTRD